MQLPLILAHGALGAWDEVIFVSIAAIFLVMMGISWVRSRTAAPPDAAIETPSATVETSTENEPDRFRLE